MFIEKRLTERTRSCWFLKKYKKNGWNDSKIDYKYTKGKIDLASDFDWLINQVQVSHLLSNLKVSWVNIFFSVNGFPNILIIYFTSKTRYNWANIVLIFTWWVPLYKINMYE